MVEFFLLEYHLKGIPLTRLYFLKAGLLKKYSSKIFLFYKISFKIFFSPHHLQSPFFNEEILPY